MPRAVCVGCARPSTVCVCAALPARKIALSTKVLVLQHPQEASKVRRAETDENAV
jgi:DTW domain-containing protein YfiP